MDALSGYVPFRSKLHCEDVLTRVLCSNWTHARSSCAVRVMLCNGGGCSAGWGCWAVWCAARWTVVVVFWSQRCEEVQCGQCGAVRLGGYSVGGPRVSGGGVGQPRGIEEAMTADGVRKKERILTLCLRHQCRKSCPGSWSRRTAGGSRIFGREGKHPKVANLALRKSEWLKKFWYGVGPGIPRTVVRQRKQSSSDVPVKIAKTTFSNFYSNQDFLHHAVCVGVSIRISNTCGFFFCPFFNSVLKSNRRTSVYVSTRQILFFLIVLKRHCIWYRDNSIQVQTHSESLGNFIFQIWELFFCDIMGRFAWQGVVKTTWLVCQTGVSCKFQAFLKFDLKTSWHFGAWWRCFWAFDLGGTRMWFFFLKVQPFILLRITAVFAGVFWERTEFCFVACNSCSRRRS